MTRPRTHTRHGLLLAVIGALAWGVLTAAPAHAATYQYWGYYQLTNGAWTFAQKGPAETAPADGSVEGWRWAITEESGTPPRTPRVAPTFEQVCDATDAQSGMKRVAVVLDYGRAVDGDGTSTPPDAAADCAVVPTGATGAEVLAAVAAVRNGDGGLVCGVNGYPATGCGGAVASLTDEQKAADTPVTLAATASASATDQTQPGSTTPGATPFSAKETAGPLVAPASGATTGSGVPVVVWVGLVILVLGVAALVWTSLQRRREDV
jgi:hypothetical protein